jgi:hypothetical protein
MAMHIVTTFLCIAALFGPLLSPRMVNTIVSRTPRFVYSLVGLGNAAITLLRTHRALRINLKRLDSDDDYAARFLRTDTMLDVLRFTLLVAFGLYATGTIDQLAALLLTAVPRLTAAGSYAISTVLGLVDFGHCRQRGMGLFEETAISKSIARFAEA